MSQDVYVAITRCNDFVVAEAIARREAAEYFGHIPHVLVGSHGHRAEEARDNQGNTLNFVVETKWTFERSTA